MDFVATEGTTVAIEGVDVEGVDVATEKPFYTVVLHKSTRYFTLDWQG